MKSESLPVRPSPAAQHSTLLSPLPVAARPAWIVTLTQSVRSALSALAAHKVRSLMTMFGIVVGTCGVLVINAVGQSQNAALARQLAQFGTNLVSITPGFAAPGGRSQGAGSKPTLTDRDVQLLQRQVPYVGALTPLAGGQDTLIAGSRTVGATITGAYPSVQAIQSHAVRLGSFFTESDEAAGAAVAVIGQTVAGQLFPSANPVGSEVRIGSVPFRVVGVLQSKGHSGQTDLDDVAIIPFSTAQRRLLGPKLDSILLQASQPADIPAVMAAATVTLRQSHHLAAGEASDFTIQDFQRAIDAAQQQAATLTRILTAVAGVALAVGGLGLMNIMLITVTERTAEIGVRLAVGAQPGDVLRQFVVEALTVSLVAGGIGEALGFALPVALRLPVHFLAQYPFVPTVVTAAIALSTDIVVGVVFGFFPAWRASRLDPVVALRSA